MVNFSKVIGFIGIGNMGEAIVCNLIDKGYQVMINDIDKEKLRKTVNYGAQATDNLNELYRNVQIIALSLPNTEIVCDVLQDNEEGIFKRANKNCTIIDFSTISPTITKKLSDEAECRGLHYIDAPVSGGTHGARNGSLTVMVGGDEEIFKKVKKFLDDVGKKVIYIGSSGSGQTAKVIQNMIGALNVISAVEGICMGIKSGLEPTILFEILSTSAAGSWLLQNYLPVQVEKNYQPASFMLNLMLKDIRLGLKAAEEVGAIVFMSSLAEQLYSVLQYKGDGTKDYSAIFNLYEQFNNIPHIKRLKKEENNNVRNT